MRAAAQAVRPACTARGPYFVVRHGRPWSHLFLRIDRLWLAERMDAHAFGLYATAMQLVEVWLQVATLLAGSMAPAFLYRAVRHSTRLRDHWRTLSLLAALGLAGLLGAYLFGPQLLSLVFGTPFASSSGYLLAGFAAGVLFFVDQFVQISITGNNRPGLLACKWAAACAVALATLASRLRRSRCISAGGCLGAARRLAMVAVAGGIRLAGAAVEDADADLTIIKYNHALPMPNTRTGASGGHWCSLSTTDRPTTRGR